MKIFLSLVIVLTGLSLPAVDVDVKGSFYEINENGMPAGWHASKWKAYQPAPKMEFTQVNGVKAIHFSEITGKAGFGWKSITRFPVKASDNVTVKFKARGSGQAWVTLQLFASNGTWIGNLPRKIITLTPEWKDYEVILPVRNTKDKITAKAIVTFGAKNKADLFIGRIKVTTP